MDTLSDGLVYLALANERQPPLVVDISVKEKDGRWVRKYYG